MVLVKEKISVVSQANDSPSITSQLAWVPWCWNHCGWNKSLLLCGGNRRGICCGSCREISSKGVVNSFWKMTLHLWWPVKEPFVFTYSILQALIGWKAKFSFLQEIIISPQKGTRWDNAELVWDFRVVWAVDVDLFRGRTPRTSCYHFLHFKHIHIVCRMPGLVSTFDDDKGFSVHPCFTC